MKTVARISLATIAFISLIVITLTLTGMTDSESSFGSILRTSVGVLLAAATFGWIRYVVGEIRARRASSQR
ncbi:hypothetical protein ACFW2Y_35780 [Streptomyces sp. NPDC058877]|uniref:hypothetical protein n=1 Tax=unclassified Streptomyces TaxID=2593676 RepID=UPI00369F1091